MTRRACCFALLATLIPLSSAPAQTASGATTEFPLACSYGSRTEGLDVEDVCAAATPTGFAIAPAVLCRIAYERGLATLAIHGEGWFYRRRDGYMVRMMTFEMGPDPFVGSLARAVIGGKLAYVDRRLRTRLRTRYDWGEPFVGGRADVCIGCVETEVDGGEHSMMTGGRWGVIDRQGHEIVPVTSITPGSHTRAR